MIGSSVFAGFSNLSTRVCFMVVCVTVGGTVVLAHTAGNPNAGRSHGRRSDDVSRPGGGEQVGTGHQEMHVAHLVLRQVSLNRGLAVRPQRTMHSILQVNCT